MPLAKDVKEVEKLTLTKAKKKFGVTNSLKSRPKKLNPAVKNPHQDKTDKSKPTSPKQPRNPEWPVERETKPNPNAPPPPPKENPNSPLAVLVKVRERLAYLHEDIKSIDWSKEPANLYSSELNEIVTIAQQISKEVPNHG